MKFVTNEPALIVEDMLIVGDLHIGIETELYRSGFSIPSNIENLKEKILRIAKENLCKKLVLLGDVKHEFTGISYQEKREIPDFLRELSESIEVHIIPGNHDQKETMASVFSDHRYLSERIHGTSDSYLCYCIEDFPVRLIGIDTVTPGNHDGGIGPARLNWLDLKLKEKPDKPTIIFMHHPPFPSGIGHMDKAPFRHREEFRALISRNPQVERVTCGHIHRSISRRFAGTLATVCPAVGMQLNLELKPDAPSGFILEPPALLLHFLDNSWDDEPALLTHVSIIEDTPGQYGGFHPFFDVISPE